MSCLLREILIVPTKQGTYSGTKRQDQYKFLSYGHRVTVGQIGTGLVPVWNNNLAVGWSLSPTAMR
jgi:hypothetical protein